MITRRFRRCFLVIRSGDYDIFDYESDEEEEDEDQATVAQEQVKRMNSQSSIDVFYCDFLKILQVLTASDEDAAAESKHFSKDISTNRMSDK